MAKYHQAVDGEWFRVPMRGGKDSCCDCGKVHVIDYRIVDGTLETRATVDERATAARRRSKTFRGKKP